MNLSSNAIKPLPVLLLLTLSLIPSFVYGETSDDVIQLANVNAVNSFGVPLESIKINQLVQITADVTNNKDTEQPFLYQIEVKNSKGQVEDQPKWITGELSPRQTLTLGLSWIPQSQGTFTVIVSVGKDLGLTYQKQTIQLDVSADRSEISTCRIGLELVYKSSDGSPVCVRPSTADKLIERGWAFR